MRRIIAVVVCNLFVLTRLASGGIIVFDQPHALGPQDSDLAGYDSYDNNVGAITTFENFSLGNSTLITDLHWYGFYGNLDAVVTAVASFDIGFYADDGGVPGSLLSSQTVVGGEFMEMAVADPAGLPNQFQYWVDVLPIPLDATAATTYYVSIQANLNSDQHWSLRAGQGDGLIWQEDAGGLFQLAGNNNVAFSLTTAAIPEPVSLLVWAAGTAFVFGGALTKRARKRR